MSTFEIVLFHWQTFYPRLMSVLQKLIAHSYVNGMFWLQCDKTYPMSYHILIKQRQTSLFNFTSTQLFTSFCRIQKMFCDLFMCGQKKNTLRWIVLQNVESMMSQSEDSQIVKVNSRDKNLAGDYFSVFPFENSSTMCVREEKVNH